MAWLDVLKSVIYGIVEGVTEWLPISSTGHLILLERLLPFTAGGNAANNSHFFSFYLVVVQLGAVMAVVVTFWPQLWPFPRKQKALPDHAPGDLTDFRLGSQAMVVDHRILRLWIMILVACVPAAIVGILFDDKIEAVFYNPLTVAIMLILLAPGIVLAVLMVVNGHFVLNLTFTVMLSMCLPTLLLTPLCVFLSRGVLNNVELSDR